MATRTTILLVDDDPQIIRFVRANLEAAGYRLLTSTDPLDALELVDLEMPDMIILDVMMPGIDGYEFCQRIREFSNMPIIMLTARDETQDKVKGLSLGADDYLTKPFSIQELLARVEAVMRRGKSPEEAGTRPSFVAGDLRVDFALRRVTLKEQEIALTHTEYKLLCQLVGNAGRVMLHQELLSEVWGPEYRDEVAYLRAYILYLRRKIEPDPHQPIYILSKPGIGYMFAVPD